MRVPVLPLMRNPSLLVFPVLLSLAAGCSGDGGGGGGGGNTTPEPDPGESSGTLQVSVIIAAIYSAGSGGEASVAHIVDVDDDNSQDVNDAIVEIGPPGEAPLVLASNGEGGYSGVGVGYSRVLELSVTRGSDYLRDVVLVGPQDFAVTLQPDPPSLGQAASVTWPVDTDAFKTVQVLAFTSAQHTYFGETVPDDGVEELPDTAFPDIDEYQIEVARSTRLQLEGTQSDALVLLRRRKNIDVAP